ncbi:RNA polymerase sigma factor [Mediterraneibacter sp. ICN-202921]|jgi:RNA polymerase sigma factor (sigma-70 family)|uniref:RNA polymerase sigma factor n=1 Tax=Mediterraneibacter sp. ICN-202921 TaxID=3134657 RepID=UPI0030C417CD
MLTGNHEFDEIYNKYKNLILKVAYKYSGDYNAAEDIAQNTFLQLYIHYHNMEKKNISSWLYTTAKNDALNYKRKIVREVYENEDDTVSILEQVRESTEDEYMKEVLESDRKELHEFIFLALMEKNQRWYEAIMLACYMKIPQAEIAEKMGISVEVLHSILHRAREWIKKNFEVEYKELNRF